ncbi:MAG: hypothetical protein C0594_05430, partial [Marinilabiliales bacterium]
DLTTGTSTGDFWSYNSPNVYLSNSADYVGLGTTAPLHKLHLSHNTSTTDGTDGTFIDIQNTNGSYGVMSGIRFYNGTTVNSVKGGIFYQDRLSFGRGDLIFANRPYSDQVNVSVDDARLILKNEGAVEIMGSPALDPNESLFHVKNADGDTVFAVYPYGVRVYMNTDQTKAAGNRGGFAVGGFSPAKGIDHEYLRVNQDSVRVYIDNANTLTGQHSGGFAVAGFEDAQAAENLMHLSEYNYFIGHRSGLKTQMDFDPMTVDNGLYNVFLGYQSGKENVWGANNVFMGYLAGERNTEGSDNVYIGFKAGQKNTDGYANMAIGYLSGNSTTTGYRNIFLGMFTGFSNTTGGDNVFIGEETGYYANGDDNVYIGALSGYNNTSGSRNVFIGNSAGRYETGNDKLIIENSSANSENALIYGEFNNNILRVNGKLGVNTSPTYLVHAIDEASNDNPAIYGRHMVDNNYGVGVRGDGQYMGVRAYASTASGSGYGLYTIATGTGTGNRYGVYSYAYGGDNAYAGYFAGNVNVTGTLSKGGGSFKIDHPLDPENKYLYHSFVESPDMKNIYDGLVVLDQNGEATVEMEDWFEALNMDFRYQLTPIGAAMPNLYISQEVSGNTFSIAGGLPGQKVSWMLTGIRHDPFANENRIPVEEMKPLEERGKYLHPSSYNMPVNMGVDYKKSNDIK